MFSKEGMIVQSAVRELIQIRLEATDLICRREMSSMTEEELLSIFSDKKRQGFYCENHGGEYRSGVHKASGEFFC